MEAHGDSTLVYPTVADRSVPQHLPGPNHPHFQHLSNQAKDSIKKEGIVKHEGSGGKQNQAEANGSAKNKDISAKNPEGKDTQAGDSMWRSCQDCREHGRRMEYWCTQHRQLACSDCMILGLHLSHPAHPAAARGQCWEHGLARGWWGFRCLSSKMPHTQKI